MSQHVSIRGRLSKKTAVFMTGTAGVYYSSSFPLWGQKHVRRSLTSTASFSFLRAEHRPDGAEQLKPSAARIQPLPSAVLPHVQKLGGFSADFLLRLLHVC